MFAFQYICPSSRDTAHSNNDVRDQDLRMDRALRAACGPMARWERIPIPAKVEHFANCGTLLTA